jgi:hypothetical protein
MLLIAILIFHPEKLWITLKVTFVVNIQLSALISVSPPLTPVGEISLYISARDYSGNRPLKPYVKSESDTKLAL